MKIIKFFFKFVFIIFGTKFVKPVFFSSGALFILGAITFKTLFLIIFLDFIIAAMWFWHKVYKKRTAKAHSDFLKAQAFERGQAEQRRQDILEQQELERQRIEQERLDLLHRQGVEKQRLIDEIQRHYSALTRNLERAVKKNDYGAKVKDNRGKVLIEFFKSINLDVNLGIDEYDDEDTGTNLIDTSDAVEIVFEQLKTLEEEERKKGFDINTLPTDGHEFEHWVASGLKIYGWKAKVTSASGDQGIDIIATKDGEKIGLQCKLLSSPVGNKAVQEAFTGKAFHQTDAVAVISNASYTASAQKLAMDTGVKLLSHHDIPNLYEKMFGE